MQVLALGEKLQSRQFPCLKTHCHTLAFPHSFADISVSEFGILFHPARTHRTSEILITMTSPQHARDRRHGYPDRFNLCRVCTLYPHDVLELRQVQLDPAHAQDIQPTITTEQPGAQISTQLIEDISFSSRHGMPHRSHAGARHWYATQVPGPLLVSVEPYLQVNCSSKPIGS